MEDYIGGDSGKPDPITRFLDWLQKRPVILWTLAVLPGFAILSVIALSINHLAGSR